MAIHAGAALLQHAPLVSDCYRRRYKLSLRASTSSLIQGIGNVVSACNMLVEALQLAQRNVHQGKDLLMRVTMIQVRAWQ
jgi:hypothetical protein